MQMVPISTWFGELVEENGKDNNNVFISFFFLFLSRFEKDMCYMFLSFFFICNSLLVSSRALQTLLRLLIGLFFKKEKEKRDTGFVSTGITIPCEAAPAAGL